MCESLTVNSDRDLVSLLVPRLLTNLMQRPSLNSYDTRAQLEVDGTRYAYFSLPQLAERLDGVGRLPYALKVLLENLLRHEDGKQVRVAHIEAFADWLADGRSSEEVAFTPARVLMQDFTGVPAIVDLAAMRDAVAALGGDPQRINPLSPVDLVIDHSVTVDRFGSPSAFESNVRREMERNGERYGFLRWGQQAFANFRVVPPGTGICHQVNLEYLASVVTVAELDGSRVAFPDTLVGTDSHTTMINGLGVLGWGVGGIEAEAAMLGQPVSMRIPEVVGVRLVGCLPEGTTATDLVLTVTERLRRHGVVGKFVEFFGAGLVDLPLPDRATIANMAPEYGATCGIFPIDDETLRYLRLSGREAAQVALVERYAKAQGLWHDPAHVARYTDVLELDLADVEPSLAGPKRPQDRVSLAGAAAAFESALAEQLDSNQGATEDGQAEPGTGLHAEVPVAGTDYRLGHGSIVVAAITSCTNTSNPSVMLAAGLLARNALARGLRVKPWVKTSLAPGSKVVTDYLEKAGLQDDLDALGFNLVGYGCTTCIGNSGPLAPEIDAAITTGNLVVGAVLSGNRNFEGRIHPGVRANYLASPPLVVAYALAGSLHIDLASEPLGHDPDGNPVHLADLWPSSAEVQRTVEASLGERQFRKRYADVFTGPPEWQAIETADGSRFAWDDRSSYVRNPPFFAGMEREPKPQDDIREARLLLLLGDSVTTDHISPAGSIPADGPAGRWLVERGIEPAEFNSFGSRRGNHEVMMRGTFANIRLQNELVPERTGGYTRIQPDGEVVSVYDAAMEQAEVGQPLVIVAGAEYGTGSSRDWAAKGTRLLGVRAVIAESFERIHRSNLIGMGVLPLQFAEAIDRHTLGIDGSETFDIDGVASLASRQVVTVRMQRADGTVEPFDAVCRIDTDEELAYFRHGGILPFVLRQLL